MLSLCPCYLNQSGEMRVGGQEHFYLETNACLVVPGENDEYMIYASSQNPNKTQVRRTSVHSQLINSKPKSNRGVNDQEWASHVLNLPASKITCHVKRLGGGFGGKETRCLIYSSAVAVAAHHLKRPVRIAVKRDLDMASSGQRAVCYPYLSNIRSQSRQSIACLNAIRVAQAFIGRYKVGFSKDAKLKVMNPPSYNSARMRLSDES